MSRTEIVAEPGVPQVLITTEFDAPRALVYRAWTEPDLLARWLGPRRLTTDVRELDLRDGGRWHFVHRDTDGTEYGFHGVFHGTPSPDGMVRTFEFEGAAGHVSLESVAFEEQDGRTIVRGNSVYQSVADRDAMIANGMERGVLEGNERLDEVLSELRGA
jgi:uncharacterized protein YndB with AHSA1/START domain